MTSNTQTLEKSKAIEEVKKQVDSLMQKCGVSFKTGFLAEEPLRYLPKDSNLKRQEDFETLDKIGHSLNKLIKEKKIIENVNKLRVPDWSFDDLSWDIKIENQPNLRGCLNRP